ncbi:hypothetical protein ACP70R_019592 [Stipagrostis hirtigluma subsp. patula]
MPSSFSVSFTILHKPNQWQSPPHPVDCAGTTRPTPQRVLQLLGDHRAWQVVDNLAVIIVEETYSALLEILGPAAPLSDGGHVEFSRPVDPADPDSPLLCVNASATHCCISLINGYYGGATAECKYTSPKPKGNPQYHLTRTTVSVSPGTLHLARVDGGGRGDCWKCADVRPDVSAKGVFGVLETIKSRLDAAIRLEARLIEMASAAGCRGPKVDEIVEARVALEKMREQVDLDAIMRRRRCQKRRRLVQEISSGTDVGQMDDAEVLAKRLTEVHVSGMSCRPAADVGDEAVLAMRLGALHV